MAIMAALALLALFLIKESKDRDYELYIELPILCSRQREHFVMSSRQNEQ